MIWNLTEKKVAYINDINDQNYFDDVQYVIKVRYGVYVYDVTDEVIEAIKSQKGLEAVAYRKDEAGLAGMLLLIIYKDPSAPLMEYWINEGVDVIWANEERARTTPEECIVRAPFDTSLDKDKVEDAKLFTVLSLSWKNSEHALLFNNEEVAVDAWRERGDDCIALTEPEWVDVKNKLLGQGDEAEFQSRGDYMTVTNAILKVTYLPDLTVSLSAPSSVKAGTTHTIKVSVSNLGESKAEDFVVRLEASKGKVTPSEQTIKLLNGTYEGNNTVTVDFTWTAPKLAMTSSYIQRVEENVNISVEVDPYDMVDELNENNNADDITVTVWDVLTRNFDCGPSENPYPSISGTFIGEITPNKTIIATKLYTYACEGTGGHTEYALICNDSFCAEAKWYGYKGDWHNISFNRTVILMPNETYNLKLITGSYPQIHHTKSIKTENGMIKCKEFKDVNGRKHEWIPAIKLLT